MGLRRNTFTVDKTSHHGLIAFTNVKTQITQDGLRRNRFMVDKTSHHGLIAFTNVKTQMAQDGFMKKHIHVGLTSHLEWHLQTADCKSVRNIPKFKDRANWSRDTFQPIRRRACVYQNTNQNIAPVIKNFHNSGQSPTESVIVLRLSGICLRLFMRCTQFF